MDSKMYMETTLQRNDDGGGGGGGVNGGEDDDGGGDDQALVMHQHCFGGFTKIIHQSSQCLMSWVQQPSLLDR